MKENTGWEQAAATIDELFHAALRADKYGELDALIGQVCALRRFAPWNAFLIAVQRPGALAVASPREWEKGISEEGDPWGEADRHPATFRASGLRLRTERHGWQGRSAP